MSTADLIKIGASVVIFILCLVGNIHFKGVIKNLRNTFPDANIVAVDYDPGASEVNQLNRIKLMLSTANKNMKPSKEK